MGAVLGLPVPFVGHYLNAEFKCLFALGLPEPARVWDTWAGSRAIGLGRHHRKYREAAGPGEAARAREDAEEAEGHEHALTTVCVRHGVLHPFATDKERLQRSFLDHAPGTAFTAEQVDYAAADAVAAAELYPHQVAAAAGAGQLDHLITVEMPWVAVNARMEWDGVRLDADRCGEIRAACGRHLAALEPRLAGFGIANVRSHPQLEAFFRRAGLLDLFRTRDGHSFDKEALEQFEDRHEAVPVIRAAKRALQLQSDPLLTGVLVGADGRAHPGHRQLGTDTGRQTCHRPNILGLGKVLRPLVVPDPGFGIGEVDLSQIEVGVAAGVYRDDTLAAMFNSGDVYSAMAQLFFAAELSGEDRALPGGEFKRRHPAKRDRMKRCTLGIIYGLTAFGLARYLGVPLSEARALLEQFMGMFPVLYRALSDAAFAGGVRGYASTTTGLRRHRGAGRRGGTSAWERNWLTNHPVQGTAAALFKRAGVRLDRLYREHDAKLIVPLHDAFVFEAPLGALDAVAELTRRVLCEAVQEEFPQLRPRAEVNVSRPGCWNKDGKADALAAWIDDPTYRFE